MQQPHRIEGKWVEYLTGRPNQPKLVESEPYIGQKPVPSTGIPNEVDRSVLQGGTIIADEQESPLESIFGNRQVTPENAHELLHKLNLLSDEDYNRVKERNTSTKNQKIVWMTLIHQQLSWRAAGNQKGSKIINQSQCRRIMNPSAVFPSKKPRHRHKQRLSSLYPVHL